MARLSYTPNGGQPIELGKWSPGFVAEIEGKWGAHILPGQRGQLMEDLGDGAMIAPLQLIFVDPADYRAVIPAISKTRRGVLLTPRRGQKNVVLRRIREEIKWTERGETTIVDLTFEEASLNSSDEFKAGPSVHASTVTEQAKTAQDSMSAQSTKVARRAFSYAVIALRKLIETASYHVGVASAAGTAYAEAALQSFSQANYDPSLSIRLREMPNYVLTAQTALRKTGVAQDIYSTDVALERMLFACTQLDASIRAAQPVPIETEITRPGGQSIYAFVAAHYNNKSPLEMRDLVRSILRINPNIRRPDLIPQGTRIVRLAA